MLELCQLNFQFAFVALGALREDVEYQATAIQDAALDQLFEVALLAGRQWMIDEDEVRVVFDRQLPDFLCLATADKEPGIRTITSAGNGCNGNGASGSGKLLELADVLRVERRAQSKADQHRTFTAPGTFKHQATGVSTPTSSS